MPELDGIAYDPLALDAVERRFWGDLWRAAPPALAAEHGVELRAFGPLQATLARGLAPVRAMNLVLGAAEAGAEELAAGLAWAEAQNVDFYVAVTPGLAGSAAAEQLLRERGYEPGYAWMKFVRGVEPPERPDPDGVEVKQLGPGDGAPLGRIVSAGFGLPPWIGALFEGVCGADGWRCYAALLDGEPVAAATLRIEGAVALCGAAATLETARGRGCQTALLHRRIRDAAAAGCRTMFVETGERTEERPSASYRNILRAGFREAYVRPNWVVQSAAG
ncbi:MAG TPA: GNAT family N-acetyltransferase [Conexibacter sp.]|nr:GNAT family N-acetyltransferase [Conexibacter sp.]